MLKNENTRINSRLEFRLSTKLNVITTKAALMIAGIMQIKINAREDFMLVRKRLLKLYTLGLTFSAKISRKL